MTAPITASTDPVAFGQQELRGLGFSMIMTDLEMDDVAAKAKEIRDRYTEWGELRAERAEYQKRVDGYNAAITVLTPDVNKAAVVTELTNLRDADQAWLDANPEP